MEEGGWRRERCTGCASQGSPKVLGVNSNPSSKLYPSIAALRSRLDALERIRFTG